MKKFITIILTLAFMISLSACNENSTSKNGENNQKINAKNLSKETEGKSKKEIEKELEKIDMTGKENIAITEFSLEMLKSCISENKEKHTNTLISPISIFSALGMTENGAVDETLRQMEETMHIKLEQTNKFFKQYTENLSNEEKQKTFIANSIWIKNDDKLDVKEDFLKVNKDYYNSEIYKADFDSSTVNDINSWVSKNTKGMINQIIDEINENTIMYLINAICFIADWETEYTEDNVFDSEFTLEDGSTQDIKMMYSEENAYLENENSKGVMKYYKDYKYAFVALLPDENLKMEEYLQTLSAEKINNMIQNRMFVDVDTKIPKFKSEYGLLLNTPLINMGMKDAFDEDNADFSKMATYSNGNQNIYINKVIHKTYIEVDEKGTKAAAVTAVEMNKCESAMPIEERKEVILNRPFLYMIYDCENDLPVFMGVTMKIN